MRFGKEVLGQGDGAFVPGNTPYTFVTGSDGVEFLEFRNATAWNIVFKSNNQASWAKGAEKTRALHESWLAEKQPLGFVEPAEQGRRGFVRLPPPRRIDRRRPPNGAGPRGAWPRPTI